MTTETTKAARAPLPITDAHLAELERLEAVASSGPWFVWRGASGGAWLARDADGGEVIGTESTLDAGTIEMIAAARNALPSLLAEVRASRASPEEGRAPIQWLGCADTVDRLNERYDAGTAGPTGRRFVALGGPTTLYDRGPSNDPSGRHVRIPAGWWIVDVGGVPAFTPYAPALRSPPAPTETRIWVPHARSCISLGTPRLACDCGTACPECNGARAVDTVDRRIPCPSCTVTAAAPPTEDEGARCLMPIRRRDGGWDYCGKALEHVDEHAPAEGGYVAGASRRGGETVHALPPGSTKPGTRAMCGVPADPVGVPFNDSTTFACRNCERTIRLRAPASSKEGGRHE